MRRKKDTGEPGNRGQFAASAKGDSGIQLGSGGPAGGDGLALLDAVRSSRVDTGTLNTALSPEQPLEVRAAATATYYPGTGERASYDPDPYVRALAAAASDLSERTRQRLAGDPHVQRLLAVLTA